jgi:hypothetical protein
VGPVQVDFGACFDERQPSNLSAFGCGFGCLAEDAGPDSCLFGETDLAYCPEGIDAASPWGTVVLNTLTGYESPMPDIWSEASLASAYDGTDNVLGSLRAFQPGSWLK